MEYNRRTCSSFLGKAGLGTVSMPRFLMSCGSTATPSTNFISTSNERRNLLKSHAF